MIQRIQSIYLLLAGIFPAITFFIPILHFEKEEGTWATLFGAMIDAAQMPELTGAYAWGILITGVFSIIGAWTAVFLYKNRKKQIKMAKYALVFNILWYAALAYYANKLTGLTHTSASPGIGCALPFLSIICLVLAASAIRKDEALVRAADRIR